MPGEGPGVYGSRDGGDYGPAGAHFLPSHSDGRAGLPPGRMVHCEYCGFAKEKRAWECRGPQMKSTSVGAEAGEIRKYVRMSNFQMDKTGRQQQRVAYNDKGKVGVDRGTEYTDRVFMDANNSLVITAIDVNDEKFFSCQVTSRSGSDTGRTQLKVFGKRIYIHCLYPAVIISYK